MSLPASAADLRDSARALIASELPPARLRAELQTLLEQRLAGLAGSLGVVAGSGFALVAVGALGRGEFLPYSDLDLVLLHEDRSPEEVRAVAEGLWYPIWDSNIGLDHSVRTVAEVVEVADADVRAALGLLRRKLIAGDDDVYRRASGLVLRSWRRRARERLPELLASARGRWERFGSVAHRAEPDLKSGRGGTRDAQLLDALALAQLADRAPALADESPGGGLAQAYARLLDIRTQLRRVTGRGRDQLLAQDADEVAATLGHADRFELARAISGIGRTVEYCAQVGLRVARNAAAPSADAGRRPLGEGVVAHGSEVVLAKEARPDLALLLRVAAASATSGLPISQAALNRFVGTIDTGRVWTREMRNNLLTVLGAGERAERVVEALGQTGLWEQILPEWAAVRDLPPRDPIHVWTVDRHLVEAAARAGELTTRVARPDLLLLGALLHDLGKGRDEDHSVVGERLAREIGPRLGLPAEDVEILAAMVRHHLILPTVAIRRDVRDPGTAAAVLAEIGESPVLLELLAALAEADSLATGPGVWGDWKARLIRELVATCRGVLAGEDLGRDGFEASAERLVERAGWLLAKARAATGPSGRAQVEWASEIDAKGGGAGELLLVGPDRVGLLAKAAAVLALHGLRCLQVELAQADGFAVAAFAAATRFGSPPSAQIIRQDLLRALDGGWDVMAGLAVKARDVQQAQQHTVLPVAVPAAAKTAEPRILWLPGSTPEHVLVEVRGADRVGLIASLATVFASAGVSVLKAKAETLGLSVVDVFVLPAAQLPEELRARLGMDLEAVLRAQ